MVRDMTHRQFIAAVKRRGWSFMLLWINFPDPKNPKCTVGVGMVVHARTKKPAYRATLAKAIRRFEELSA